MNAKKIIGLLVLIVLAGLYFTLPEKSSKKEQLPPPEDVSLSSVSALDTKNISFEIEGVLITLKKGEAETETAPGSASKTVTRYFGNEAAGDLNGDGREDTAFLVTQTGGGSGLFYYAVAVLKTTDGYKTTNAFLIGDRIAPQSTNISGAKLLVNYAERKPSEPMSAQPSVGVTKVLSVTFDGKLTDGMENWKTTTDGKTGASFKYPERLPTEYIAGADWPPTLQITSESFGCKTEKQTIDGREYCITTSSEGAAGSTYTTYSYSSLINGKTAAFTFILRAVQCANYDEPKKSACEKEQSSFDVSALADRMTQSLLL